MKLYEIKISSEVRKKIVDKKKIPGQNFFQIFSNMKWSLNKTKDGTLKKENT